MTASPTLINPIQVTPTSDGMAIETELNRDDIK
jgi:hypothetical protein